MTTVVTIRKFLFVGGLTAIILSFVLDSVFANDEVVDVPEPNILSLIALGGVVAIGLSVIRRRKK
jgi:uncharacterized membrane protein YjfL (UPF0719 family)